MEKQEGENREECLWTDFSLIMATYDCKVVVFFSPNENNNNFELCLSIFNKTNHVVDMQMF